MDNKFRFFKYIIIITLLLSPFIYKISQKYLYPQIDEKSFLKVVYPDASYFSAKVNNPSHYNVYNSNKELIGAVFLSSDIFPDEKGYAGIIKIFIGLNKNGTITGIKIISHSETPSYANGITQNWFTDQYKNLSTNNSFEIGKDIDGISRATVSVTAINRIIKKSIRFIGKEIFYLPLPIEQEVLPFKLLINKHIHFMIFIFIFAIIAFKTKNINFRNICMILGIIYLGFILENFLSITNILNILYWKLPDFSNFILWYILMFLILLTTVIWGRVYCFYLCPFGGVQEFIYKLNRLKTLPAKEINEKANGIKFLILWIIIIITSITGNYFLTSYEPFSTLFGRTGTIVSWILVVAVLLLSFIYNRFWCRYFCAVGALLDLIKNIKKLVNYR